MHAADFLHSQLVTDSLATEEPPIETRCSLSNPRRFQLSLARLCLLMRLYQGLKARYGAA